MLFHDRYRRYSLLKPSDSTCLDFSTGTHLQNPIGLSLLGFKRIYTADIERIARVELIRDVIRKYRCHQGTLNRNYALAPDVGVTAKNMTAELASCFRIWYLAPVAIQSIGLDEGSIDFVVSRSTLEHVPERAVADILRKCVRLLKVRGIAVLSIDYRDHWSFFDPDISVYNFLQYSPTEWRRLNPRIHYQNRLRHVDYRRMCLDAGFRLLEDEESLPPEHERARLDLLRIDERILEKYERDQLRSTRGLFVLQKPMRD
jgi:SAM-dependent methyltransferase